MNQRDVEAWLTGYRKAWLTDDRDDIAALFVRDARYSPNPWRREWLGLDDIIEQWVARGGSKLKWRFDHVVLGIDGDTAIVDARVHYEPTDDTPQELAYANVWLIQLAGDGRARRFAEWWMQRPDD